MACLRRWGKEYGTYIVCGQFIDDVFSPASDDGRISLKCKISLVSSHLSCVENVNVSISPVQCGVYNIDDVSQL